MNTAVVQNTNPIQSEKDIRLKDIYETYCLWKSLPALFRYPPQDKNGNRPAARDFAEQMGVDDDKILSLVSIKTQTEFALRFEVSPDTLTDWNKTIGVKDGLADMRQWGKFLSKNVLVSLYNTAVKKGMSFEVKLWFQLIEQWSEKNTVKHEGLGDINFNITLNKKSDANKLGAVGEADRSVGAVE